MYEELGIKRKTSCRVHDSMKESSYFLEETVLICRNLPVMLPDTQPEPHPLVQLVIYEKLFLRAVLLVIVKYMLG